MFKVEIEKKEKAYVKGYDFRKYGSWQLKDVVSRGLPVTLRFYIAYPNVIN